MSTHQLRCLNESRMVIGTVPCGVGILDNAIVIRLKEPTNPYTLEELMVAVGRFWTDRNVIILPHTTEFVELREVAP